jgi:hypothetical protein
MQNLVQRAPDSDPVDERKFGRCAFDNPEL